MVDLLVYFGTLSCWRMRLCCRFLFLIWCIHLKYSFISSWWILLWWVGQDQPMTLPPLCSAWPHSSISVLFLKRKRKKNYSSLSVIFAKLQSGLHCFSTEQRCCIPHVEVNPVESFFLFWRLLLASCFLLSKKPRLDNHTVCRCYWGTRGKPNRNKKHSSMPELLCCESVDCFLTNHQQVNIMESDLILA